MAQLRSGHFGSIFLVTAAQQCTSLKLPNMLYLLLFLKRPEAFTGKSAGEVGFDQFEFVKDWADLMSYREAEVQHGRLAKLAGAGWVAPH